MSTITYDFTDRVAFVTGAASGMGRATAERFADAGAAVGLLDLRADDVQRVVDRIEARGGRALALPADVSDEEQVAEAVRATVDRFGGVDMAFNGAGIQFPATSAALEDLERFERTVAVNLRGVWAAMKHELLAMEARGRGAIVNCSSLGGLVGNPGRAAYHGTKFGVVGMTMSAALEYAPRGIRVNAVCPGVIDTPMVRSMIASGDLEESAAAASAPMGRLGTADEIADSVLWLCSDAAGYVTGVALPVDGGYVAR